MYLVKLKSGHYAPYDSEDHEASSKIAVGDVVKASKARNYEFHKKAFALLNLGFENQEDYTLFEVYRKIIIIRSGYYDQARTKGGEVHYIPQSLSFENMKAEDFDLFYNTALEVISKDLGTDSDTINEQIEGFY